MASAQAAPSDEDEMPNNDGFASYNDYLRAITKHKAHDKYRRVLGQLQEKKIFGLRMNIRLLRMIRVVADSCIVSRYQDHGYTSFKDDLTKPKDVTQCQIILCAHSSYLSRLDSRLVNILGLQLDMPPAFWHSLNNMQTKSSDLYRPYEDIPYASPESEGTLRVGDSLLLIVRSPSRCKIPTGIAVQSRLENQR